jgi:hypothetical protein
VAVRGKKQETDPVASPALAAESATRAAAVTAEASARSAADAAEAAARASAVASEAIARAADVDDEMTRAEAAEVAEAQARAAADSAESAARAAQDATLAAADATEQAARTTADTNEANTRAAADTALANSDAAETSARQAADSAEATARTAAITAEAAARTSGDAALTLKTETALRGISTVDVAGESIGVGVGASLTDANNFVDRLCRMLGGVKDRRNFSIGGACACWHTNNGTIGQAGWGWFIGGQSLHGLYPRQGWGAPYYPVRDLGILKYGLNDLAALGASKPRPFQEALRNLISAMLACNAVQTTDGSWAFTGTWSALSTAGAAAGPIGAPNYRSTVTVGDKAVLTLPASFPAGRVLAITVTVNPTYSYTLGIKINGADQADVVVDGSAICDSNLTQLNQLCLRFPGRAAGDTIELNLKARTAGNLLIDEARIEAATADAPIVLLPNLHTPTDFTFWATPNWAHGYNAGSDPINAAGVAAFNTALLAVAGEFAANVIYVDIDTLIGANGQANTLADGVHPNDTGYGLIAKKLYDTLVTSGLATADRQSRTTRVAGFYSPAIIGAAAWPGLNSWSVPTTEPHVPLGFYKDVNGRVWLSGSVVGGSSPTAAIYQLPGGYRPGRDRYAGGTSSASAAQRWKIAADGTISIVAGGDTTRSTLDSTSFMPGA